MAGKTAFRQDESRVGVLKKHQQLSAGLMQGCQAIQPETLPITCLAY